jgi:hypothetical protein
MKKYLCLIKHHPTKAYGGMEIYLHAFLTSALYGCFWSASYTGKEIGPIG